jgi:tetratricopeptide (TPR) repeat protein
MDQEKIEQYLKKVRLLSIQLNDSEKARQDLEGLIEKGKLESEGNSSYENFFLGEINFYAKDYETALKHYLQAQAVHNFTFFCYRASAYLFEQMNNLEKALDFAKKALKIFPSDYLTLFLMENLLKRDLQAEDALEIRSRLNALEKEVQGCITSDQIEELAHIFEERQNPQELFAEERAPSAYMATTNQNFPVTNVEIPMNTDSDIFSSPKSQETGITHSLTERLYTRHKEFAERDPFTGKTPEQNSLALEELKKLAGGSSSEREPFNQFIANELGIDLGTGQALEQRIKAFQLAQTDLISQYLLQGKSRFKNPDFCFYYLNGWQHLDNPKSQQADPFFLTEQSRRTNGGLFIRWNGKGIVINPGSQFLKNFHEQGLHIHDIDFVIVTDDKPENYADVKEIYDLNYQLNKVNQQLQIIHYYFNHKAFQDLSRILKPHFKQERHTLHSLEIFLDSPDVEKLELSDGIHLNYFQASHRDVYMHSRDTKDERKNLSLLGMRLDLKTPASQVQDKASVRIGYIGHSAWNPLLAHHLGSCDLLVTGFGNTSPNDFNKISYNQDCLGYYGTFTLLEEIAPKLLLTGEYSGREGDIRLEVSQKIRNEYLSQVGSSQRQLPVVLPADTGLFLCLKSLKIYCSVSNTWIEPSQIRVIKTADSFGQLEYLSPSCCYQ